MQRFWIEFNLIIIRSIIFKMIQIRTRNSIAGISNVKSREDLVMDLSSIEADPFGSAPFHIPTGKSSVLI